MTTPNYGSTDDLNDYQDAANAVGLAAMQAMDAEEYLQSKINEVVGPFGGIIEMFTDGLGMIITDVQNYATTGDTANMQAAQNLVQTRIDGIIGAIISVFEALWDAMTGEYTGDDFLLIAIQTLFAPIRTLLEVVSGVVTGDIPTVGEIIDGWGLTATFDAIENEIAKALRFLADLLDMVPFVGDTLHDILTNIANGLNGTDQTATDAKGLAEIKSRTTHSDTEPPDPDENDLWVQKVGEVNVYKIWDGDSWEPAPDQIAKDAEQAAHDAQEAINNLINSMPKTGVPGQTVILLREMKFTGANWGLLNSADWDFVGWGSTASPVLRDHQYSMRIMTGDTSYDRRYHARAATRFTNASGQGIGVMLSGSGSTVTSLSLILAADENITTGVALYIFKDRYFVGTFNRSNQTWNTVETWQDYRDFNFQPGQWIEFQLGQDGKTFRILVNGSAIWSQDHTGYTNATRRRAAVTMRAGLRNFSTREVCFEIRQANLYDLHDSEVLPAATAQPSFWLFRSNTSPTVAFEWNWGNFPAGTFDETYGMSFCDLVSDSGIVRVHRTGWWMLRGAVQVSAGMTDAVTVAFHRSTNNGTTYNLCDYGGWKHGNTSWNVFSGTTLTWLDEGDLIKLTPTATGSPSNIKVIGSIGGAITHFKGTYIGAGQRGETGPAGPQGAASTVPGPTGAQGPIGATGATGPVGPQGIQGPTGLTGPPGAAGAPGAQGATGATGAQGPQGLPGADGKSVTIQGSRPSSVNLPVGLGPGDAGKGWITDDTGHLWVWSGTAFNDVGLVRGPAGLPGATGTPGQQGPQGERGFPGGQGPQGSPGLRGPEGPAGATGSPGLQGPVGPAGAQGAPGIPGVPGITGPQGPQGEDGTGIDLAGTVDEYTDLPTTAERGDAWLVTEDRRLYVWNGIEFPAFGNGVAIEGVPGPQGPPGDSYYFIEVAPGLWDTTMTLVENPEGSGLYEIGEPYFESGGSWVDLTQAEFDTLPLRDPDTMYLITDAVSAPTWAEITQAEYDASTHDPNTLYLIVN